jgi:phage terminase large subunit GpA-like protein
MVSNLAVQWYPGEMEIWEAKEDLSTSAFAEKYRSVTIGAHRGQWDNSVTPYLTGIMDAADLPWVEEIVISGPPQSGKTNGVINILLKNFYRYGGNGKFIMFPNELLSKLFFRVRLVPILQGCPPLARRISPDPRDTTSEKISLRDGTHIFPAWGSSAAKLSSFPADCCASDEIDKNADLTGDETDPLSLLEDRVRTARRRIILKCSSPTLETGHIWRALLKCLYLFHQFVVCPHCGEAQRMDETRLTWPGQAGLFDQTENGISQPTAEPELLKSMKIVRYVCAGCACLWDDQERNQAVKLGGWRTDAGVLLADALATRPRSVGFQIEGFTCPDISLSDLAAEIINARSGDPAAEKRRDNSFFGRPHQPKAAAERKTDSILRLVDEHQPRGVVPQDTARLIIKADTQKTGFMYQVLALGYADKPFFHLVDHGFKETFEQLNEYGQQNEFYDAAGLGYRCIAGIIDSGGGTNPYNPKHSRTAEVYEFCRLNPFWRPVKGRRDQATPWSITRLEYYPARDGSKVAIPGGLNLYTINVTLYKNQLAGKLNLEPGSPGSITLHAGLNDGGPHSGQQYAAQLCAEYQDKRGYWECPKGKANHFWDCWVYGLALADILGMHRKKKTAASESKPQQALPQAPINNRQLPSWLLNRRR